MSPNSFSSILNSCMVYNFSWNFSMSDFNGSWVVNVQCACCDFVDMESGAIQVKWRGSKNDGKKGKKKSCDFFIGLFEIVVFRFLNLRSSGLCFCSKNTITICYSAMSLVTSSLFPLIIA